jgi:hypothetical protein
MFEKDFEKEIKEEIEIERENGTAICKHMSDLVDSANRSYQEIKYVEEILGQKINNPYSLRLAEDAQEATIIIHSLMCKLNLIKNLYGDK